MSEKMKLLYITRYSIDEPFNLKKKFDGQLAAFRKLGFDVYFIGFDRKHLYLMHGEQKTVYGNTHFAIPSYLHTQFYKDLHKAAIKAIREIGFDYIYWRTEPLFSSSCKVAKNAKETGAKVIIEIPTFPSNKEDNMKGIRKIFDAYSNNFSDKFNQLVDLYAVIGEDAGGSYKGKPAVNIENGIDLNNIRNRNPKQENKIIHILAVSAMCYWHGYDRLINSLAAYQGEYQVKLHLVGGTDGECAGQWKQLAKDLGVSENVLFHGYMYGKELDELADLCDLGCASLRRRDYSHISELKTREYTARGLPFILASKDDTFDLSKKQFYYEVSNDDSIPDMEGIVDFALQMRQDKEMVSYMRRFASEYLTWETQYEKLFKKLDKLVL